MEPSRKRSRDALQWSDDATNVERMIADITARRPMHRKGIAEAASKAEIRVAKRHAKEDNDRMGDYYRSLITSDCAVCEVRHFVQQSLDCSTHATSTYVCKVCEFRHRFPSSSAKRYCVDNVVVEGNICGIFCTTCKYVVWQVPGVPFACLTCGRVAGFFHDHWAMREVKPLVVPIAAVAAVAVPARASLPVVIEDPSESFEGHLRSSLGEGPPTKRRHVGHPHGVDFLPSEGEAPLFPDLDAHAAPDEDDGSAPLEGGSADPSPMSGVTKEEAADPTMMRQMPDPAQEGHSIWDELIAAARENRMGEVQRLRDTLYELADAISRGGLEGTPQAAPGGPFRGPKHDPCVAEPADLVSLRDALEYRAEARLLLEFLAEAQRQFSESGRADDDLLAEIEELTETLPFFFVDNGFGGVKATLWRRAQEEWMPEKDGKPHELLRGEDWLGVDIWNGSDHPVVAYCVDKHDKLQDVLELNGEKFATLAPRTVAENKADDIMKANLRWTDAPVMNPVTIFWRYVDGNQWMCFSMAYKVTVEA